MNALPWSWRSATPRAPGDRSPWIGEGHRKVLARLRVLDGIRVARKRVLRLMRENALLSPDWRSLRRRPGVGMAIKTEFGTFAAARLGTSARPRRRIDTLLLLPPCVKR